MSRAGESEAPAVRVDGPEPAAPLGTGHIIGDRYVIEERISEGTFGQVYRASDRAIPSHQVALKLLHQPAASDAARAEALRELMLIASVSHPSVVQFKDYGWYQHRLWFTMPWYRGRPLNELLEGDGCAAPMSRARAKTIFVRIAQGLAAMHAVGIHHHDIKPENIFIAEIAGFPGGFPVLLDLGIAAKRGENPKGLTVDYASPETAAAMIGLRSDPIGAASDVYSLALSLRNALDPELVTDEELSEDLVPRLTERATKPTRLPAKRDLRYLAPYFTRWLNLNPDLRPTASRLAEELAVLTEPEEKREARSRLLKRVGPVIGLSAALIAVLAGQVRVQQSALSAQGQILEEERSTAEKLRHQATSQLHAIEDQARTLGNEREQLRNAIAVGRRLDRELLAADQRADHLYRRTLRLSASRDALVQQGAILTSERDNLLRDKRTLSLERDLLRQQAHALGSERDALLRDKAAWISERTQLLRDRGVLISERDALSSERNALERARTSLKAERDVLVEEKAHLKTAHDALLRDKNTLTAERDALAKEKQTLAAENQELRKQLDAPNTGRNEDTSEEFDAPKPPDDPASSAAFNAREPGTL